MHETDSKRCCGIFAYYLMGWYFNDYNSLPSVVMSSVSIFFIGNVALSQCLQCFDAVGWATGRASGL